MAAKCYHPPGAHLLILSKAAFSQSQVEAKRGLPPPHGKKTREDPRGLQIGASTLPKPLGCFGTNVQPAKHHSVRHPASGLGDLRLLCVSSFFARPFLSFPAPLEICSTEAAQLADRRTPSTLLHHNSTYAPSNSLLPLLHHPPTLFRPTVVCLARARSRRLYGLGVRRG